MKNILYLTLILSIFSCENPKETINKEVRLSGYAQGTTYHVTYLSKNEVSYERSIDSLLIEIDNSLSTYQKKSIISKFNKTDSTIKVDQLFEDVFVIAKDVYQQTEGAFNPAIAPIVNAWGFGFENVGKTDSVTIDSLMQLIDFNDMKLENGIVSKSNKGAMLDFNAVAQGHSVDVLANFLKSKGINNYMVEIGGEVIASGHNRRDTLWRVGIDKPLPNLESREIEAIVNLNNKALVTSGNYRKSKEKNGVKYSHTIDPKTGYPVAHNLLSATVIADNCAYADAYATAFMVMGLTKSQEFLSRHKELDALLIFSTERDELETFMTEGIERFIELSPSVE